MREKMNKEQWIDDVMSSTQGMLKAEPGADFYEQVRAKLNRPVAVKGVSMPLKQWAVAAVFLLAVNISSIVYFMDHGKKSVNGLGSNPLTAEMQLESTYNY